MEMLDCRWFVNCSLKIVHFWFLRANVDQKATKCRTIKTSFPQLLTFFKNVTMPTEGDKEVTLDKYWPTLLGTKRMLRANLRDSDLVRAVYLLYFYNVMNETAMKNKRE